MSDTAELSRHAEDSRKYRERKKTVDELHEAIKMGVTAAGERVVVSSDAVDYILWQEVITLPGISISHVLRAVVLMHGLVRDEEEENQMIDLVGNACAEYERTFIIPKLAAHDVEQVDEYLADREKVYLLEYGIGTLEEQIRIVAESLFLMRLPWDPVYMIKLRNLAINAIAKIKFLK